MAETTQLIDEMIALAPVPGAPQSTDAASSEAIRLLLVHGRNLSKDIKPADRGYYINSRVEDPRVAKILSRMVEENAFGLLAEIQQRTGQRASLVIL